MGYRLIASIDPSWAGSLKVEISENGDMSPEASMMLRRVFPGIDSTTFRRTRNDSMPSRSPVGEFVLCVTNGHLYFPVEIWDGKKNIDYPLHR